MEATLDPTPIPKLRNVAWLAQRLDVPVPTIYRWRTEGKIPEHCVVRLGKILLFDEERLAAWLAAGGTAAERPVRWSDEQRNKRAAKRAERVGA